MGQVYNELTCNEAVKRNIRGRFIMKKIAYVITQSELGGAQKNVLLLCQGLKDRYDITVYSAPGGKMIDELQAMGVRHIAIDEMVREINPIMDFKCLKHLKKEFKENKFDIVHCHSSKAGILGREAAHSAGISKIVYTAHGFVFNEPMSNLKKKIYTFLEAYESRKTTSLICVNEGDIEVAKENGIIPKKEAVYVPNGIDFNESEETQGEDIEAFKKKFNITSEDFVFGCVANFYETKGHRYLIQAFNDLCQEGYKAKLLLIGDGQLLPEMKTLAEGNNSIIFTGYVDNASEKMKAMDCFVMSSVKEGFPFVILEAVKNKIPIISTDVGAVRKIIKGEELGIITEPGNAVNLRLSMIKAIENYEEMKEKAEKSYQLNKERYSLEAMIKATESLY